MNQMEALRRLEALGVEGFSVRDVAAVLHVKPGNAHIILRRLAGAGHVMRLAQGRWALVRKLQTALLAEHIAAPAPAYISLQSALFHHSLIEQIPAVTYAVTVGRGRTLTTPAGGVSLHHIAPALFTGFELLPEGGKMARAEKALFDLLYLGPARTRLFNRLPELEIPRRFDWRRLQAYLERVVSKPRRSYLEARIKALRG